MAHTPVSPNSMEAAILLLNLRPPNVGHSDISAANSSSASIVDGDTVTRDQEQGDNPEIRVIQEIVVPEEVPQDAASQLLEGEGPGKDQSHNSMIHWRQAHLMLATFALGLFAAIGHFFWYWNLKGKTVRSKIEQEHNIQMGSILASIQRASLATSVWFVFMQWFWREWKKRPMSLIAIDCSFSVQTSFWSLFRPELAKKATISFSIAIIAWSLQVPT
jgi:hypothetical protein